MNTEDQTAGIGHNQSPFESLKARIDDVIKSVDNAIEQHPEITEQAVADEFTNLVDMARACKNEAETQRKEEKAPHDEAIKDIQGRFKPLGENLDLAINALKRRVGAFLVRQQQEAEAERKRQEEEALAKMQEAEEAERKAAETGSVSAQIQAQEAKERAEDSVKQAGAPVGPARARGEFSERAMGLRSTYSAAIDNFDQVYAHFRDDQKVKDVLQQLANAEARAAKGDEAAFNVPGARLHETKIAA
jgi:hypothetical protein